MKYKNPAATATIIVERDDGKILLVRRKHPPFEGKLALPGGFLNCGKEDLETAAQRELFEETNLHVGRGDLHLLCVNSSPIRDPREHVIDHVYVVRKFSGEVVAKDDAAEIVWIDKYHVPLLAFDHTEDVNRYLEGRI